MLNINMSVITEASKIDEILEVVAKNSKDKDFQNLVDYVTVYDFFEFYFVETKKHNVHMLSTPPPISGDHFVNF